MMIMCKLDMLDKQDLLEEIEKQKRVLIQAAVSSRSLSTGEVLRVSRQLDELILQYYASAAARAAR